MNKDFIDFLKEAGFREIEITNENEIFFSNLFFLYFKSNKLKTMRSLIGDTKSSQNEFYVYFDSILVQFRAMLLDYKYDKQKNIKIYSFQNFLLRNNKKRKFNKLEKYLDSKFIDKKIKKENKEEFVTIRTAIKRITDKNICHFEKDVDKYYIDEHLANPYSEVYILKIINNVFEICDFPKIELEV